MDKLHLHADGKYLPAITLALYEVASHALFEAVNAKGPGPWFDELREKLEFEFKNTVFTGTPISDEPGAVEAAIAAIRNVFDRIDWGDQTKPSGMTR